MGEEFSLLSFPPPSFYQVRKIASNIVSEKKEKAPKKEQYIIINNINHNGKSYNKGDKCPKALYELFHQLGCAKIK